MDSNIQFKQLSAPSICTYTNTLSSSSGSSSSRNQYTNNFWENYEHLCVLQNLVPLQSLKSCLSADAGIILNINADKLKLTDWDPVLNTIRITKNLKTIKIHSNFIFIIDENEAIAKGYSKLKKPPSIRNKEKTNKMCRSLKDCLTISHFLNTLELYNLPLTIKDSTQIAKGLKSNKSIKFLSLDRCLIGDESLAIICKEIQSSSNLNRINFSSCNLTHEGANILATLIKVQALKRHNEAWKDSLRYGRPDLDSMFGIRRITINSNQLIGDKGVQALADAFKSDLWLKALDLQDCGITTIGANYLLDGLKFNAMMHVLDVRLNLDIDRDTLQKIMEQVMINSSGNNTEYEWMDLTQTTAISLNKNSPAHKNQANEILNIDTPRSSITTKKNKKRRNTNSSFTKKPQLSLSTISFKLKRCKSTGSVIFNKSQMQSQQYNKQNNIHIPWRAAARANRFKISTSGPYRKINGFTSFKNINENDKIENSNNHEYKNEDEYEEEILDYNDEENQIEDENDFHFSEFKIKKNNNLKRLNRSYENELSFNKQNSQHNYIMASSTFDYDKFANNINNNNNNNTIKLMTNNNLKNKKLPSNESLINNDFVSSIDKIKNFSVKDLLSILQKEQVSKTKLEDLLLQLQDENTKLKSQISTYKLKIEQQQQQINILSSKQNNSSTLNRTLFDDEKALEIIEFTLHKYQNFLDFLRNAGFGKLIDIGEMNQHQETDAKYNKQKIKNNQLVQKQDAELLKQQKKTYKEKLQFLRSPSKTKSPIADQQKFYLNKINKNKEKLKKNSIENNETTNLENFNSSININNSISSYEPDVQNIDTLLSNALEISRSFRRFNSSSINNSTIYQNYNSKKTNSEKLLSDIVETNKENNSFIYATNLSGINELQKSNQTLISEYNNKKQSINNNENFNKFFHLDLVNSEKKEINYKNDIKVQLMNNNENIKTSPKTIEVDPKTVLTKRNQIKASIKSNSLTENHDKEIEVEDVSEILSEDDSHFVEKQFVILRNKMSDENIPLQNLN